MTLVAAGMLASAFRVEAAEAGFSHFLPEMAGDIAIAQSPQLGLQPANTVWIQTADAGAAVLQGLVNLDLGRNYWSFDTAGAVTWLSSKTGTEISIAPGIMFNTRNEDIDYETGAELHLDFTINQFLSETFALGLRGYHYRQVTGDSGSRARLGDFESRSVGIGPGLFWNPKQFGGRLVFLGKWMHDLSTN